MGSNSEGSPAARYARSTLGTGHRQAARSGPFRAANKRLMHRSKAASLLDHFVGVAKQRRRDIDAEGPGGPDWSWQSRAQLPRIFLWAELRGSVQLPACGPTRASLVRRRSHGTFRFCTAVVADLG